MSDDGLDSQGSDAETPYQGVHGGLLFLCVVLVFVVPFVGGFNLINNYQRASSDLEYVQGMHLFLIMDTILRAFLIGFSMYAGASLWSLWPGALLTVKIYLYTFLGTLFLGLALLFILVDWPPEAQELLKYEIVREVLPSLLYFSACMGYIKWSRRVKATYPD